MKDGLLSIMACPQCRSQLSLTVFEREGQEIVEGVLSCEAGHWYPIERAIGRMLPEDLYDRSRFVQTHRALLGQLGLGKGHNARGDDSLAGLKERTICNFGFEWVTYKRFGWDDPVFNIEREEVVFRAKSQFGPEDLAGQLVLDAGCGNGRYSYWASRFGAEVVAVDLGDGVESAYENLKGLKVHVVQGDLLRLPFRPGVFDGIFSIGVLMHTGDAKRASESLLDHLKPDGRITVHVYGRGNVVYETVDRLIRLVTTRLSVKSLMTFTRWMQRLASRFDRAGLLHAVNCVMRLDTHPHCIFDWYGAPIATHHTCEEVKGWLEAKGCRVLGERGSWPRTGWRKWLLTPLMGNAGLRSGSVVNVQAAKPA